ncbi:hypothetical protein [Pectobacterium aquaticum]|uniref:hypothetical protein n=1 Tax=Pectobacterium aquaticum TaxID=2204145 RepID=UPI001E3C5999|nr:hypothetical protein [Pectobacterium aquaticum]UEM40090.1 hypothetical protein DMB82_0003395 [Pectobacterium aquaticum]
MTKTTNDPFKTMHYSIHHAGVMRLILQNAAKPYTECKSAQMPEPQPPRGLAVWFAPDFFCKIFMIQIVQAGAV